MDTTTTGKVDSGVVYIQSFRSTRLDMLDILVCLLVPCCQIGWMDWKDLSQSESLHYHGSTVVAIPLYHIILGTIEP